MLAQGISCYGHAECMHTCESQEIGDTLAGPALYVQQLMSRSTSVDSFHSSPAELKMGHRQPVHIDVMQRRAQFTRKEFIQHVLISCCQDPQHLSNKQPSITGLQDVKRCNRCEQMVLVFSASIPELLHMCKGGSRP